MELRIERLDLTNHWLTRSFRVSHSSCDNPEYFSEYLRDAALVDWKKGLATTHLLIREQDGEERIIGYITLRASSYTKDVGGIVLGDPAVEIFELAIADGEEKSGMGAELMKFALLTAAELREIIGVRYVLLCSTKAAMPFYEKMGFERIGLIGEVPRDQMNQNCIPMYIMLPEEQ